MTKDYSNGDRVEMGVFRYFMLRSKAEERNTVNAEENKEKKMHSFFFNNRVSTTYSDGISKIIYFWNPSEIC